MKELNSYVLKVYGTVAMSPEQQAQIEQAYSISHDVKIVMEGSIRKFGEHSDNDDNTEDITSKFKVITITEINTP
jgi:hypothetical protein